MLEQLYKEVNKLADVTRAKLLSKFFKTGKDQYGEGDLFLGLTVPQSRTIVKKFHDLSISETSTLLRSPYHEHRLIALLILTKKYPAQSQLVNNLYLKSTRYINNWDLVDLTAPKIVGEYLIDKPIDILFKLANSKNLWERRIAIMATFAFIYNGNPKPTLEIAEKLLIDKEDLIHKAVGWMLREVGKRISQATEEEFLLNHYQSMPRTMLRYAIERFPETLRQKYLRQ